MEVWQEMKKSFRFKVELKNFTNIKLWLMDFLEKATDNEAIIFTVTAWHIWEARNDTRNGIPMPHPRYVAETSKAYVEMILMHNTKPAASTRCESSLSVPKWSPPPEELVMANVDAVVFAQCGQMGVGLVIRNHREENV